MPPSQLAGHYKPSSYQLNFDGDSGEEIVVKKTPKNKTPQGRNSQSMSAKKVSFELSGKKTPGKTPQKNNSFIGKKQPTPVAKGMKGVQKKMPQSEEMDDDDDDDDEDDDDFELDMDEDDSDDDIEDDGDDDDDDDDDDDEEEEQIQKQKSNSKQLMKLNPKQTPKGKSSSKDDSDEDEADSDEDEADDSDEDEEDDSDEEEEQFQKQKNVKTPTKGADKSKEPQMLKANTPKNKIEENGKSKEKAAGLEMNAERRRERDLVSLFAGNLPADTTPDELRALSSDIIDIHMPLSKNRSFTKYAFLTFTSEEKTDANYKALQGRELRGRVLNIDYRGEKSSKPASNSKELKISGIPRNGTIADVATRFPKAYVVSMSGSELNRSAKIGFLKEEDAAEAYNLKEIEIDGHKLAILFSARPVQRKNHWSQGPNKRNFEHQGYNPAKKMRFSK
ncbi:RRM domain-containing protein [Trichonephila clavata]|uniref:RRM domain-containing protein n=1 Tax=Trichonephila clavata TaxID=2740835 RepID=A0A8X6KFC2_TRICU|nr:RRM domain-containing protein [Trichonephila clavata]